MVINALLLFDEVVVVAIFACGVGRGVSDGGEFDLGDEKPLEERKGDSNNGADGNENLGSEIWENGCSHGWKRSERVFERKGKREGRKE